MRTVVVGAVLAVATVLGTAPAASAAPAFGIAWQVTGDVSMFQGPQICPTGQDFQPGQSVQVLVHVNGAWKAVQTVQAPAGSTWSCIHIKTADLVDRIGRYSFRAVTRASAGAPAVAAQLTVNVVQEHGHAEAVAPEFSYSVWKTQVTAGIGRMNGQIVELQRLDGSHWVPVHRVRAPRDHSQFTEVRLTAPPRAGHAAYRVVNYGTAWTKQGISNTVRIHQTDFARYQGYIATARRYMAGFCPHTPIHIDTPDVTAARPGNPLGRANGASSGGRGGGELTTRISLRSGMTGQQLQHVALHECAHVVQYRAHVLGRFDIEDSRALQAFGSIGREGQADCMAYQQARSKRHLYYVDDCSSAQVADAVRMWQAYGYRFQASPYRW
jgi:hypothetical protein